MHPEHFTRIFIRFPMHFLFFSKLSSFYICNICTNREYISLSFAVFLFFVALLSGARESVTDKSSGKTFQI